ncbi:S-Ena type endospore appendage [Paenibacillus sp. SYP-B4298]|uniref:S-Ena type endospore appendage n=1 Tax=Paenibacillus sp. SYP-B4298 TaxID=2996034 RepID=UPI0022DE71D9|nr:S-Ena type endospore appendage [Paenibacillus sp. SYP-B4298]
MSCSSAQNCCQQPIVSVCLPSQDYALGTAVSSLIFGPSPSPVAASGIISNNSTNSASITYTFRRGTRIVTTIAGVGSGQTRAFAVSGFTTISATATVGSAIANLCMTEFFRPSV